MSYQHDNSSDNDSDYYDRDPGREVIEKNIRNRLQRIAEHTKDELNKVLKRVDNTLNNYEYSVQSSLIQHGMSINDMSNVEHVADIKELESLLNDSLAKQRYKQRLMVFIVGQTEQASEKTRLLQQIEQFFSEQKQSFSAKEFNNYDNVNEISDDIDIALKSFDVKDCYIHVKTLGTRLNELNEEIVQYLIQNVGTKQQVKGKKKFVQIAKEAKDQLANLQSKLEITNTEMNNRDNKIQTLETEIETIRNEMKIQENKFEDQLHEYENEIQSCKNTINELEENIEQYRYQIDDLTKTISTMQQTEIENTTDAIKTKENDQKSDEAVEHSNQIDVEEVQLSTIPDKEIQISDPSDLNLLFKSNDEIDLNNITIENLQKHAIVRIKDLLRELEIKESINNETLQNLQKQFNEHKEICEKEQIILIEQAENAYQLQIKAQTTAEEAIIHLQAYMKEPEKLKSELIHQETQTDETLENINIIPEHINPIEELPNDRLSSVSKNTTDEFESIENFRRESIKDKYISLIEEKRQELDQLKQQADIILSRPASIRHRLTLPSLETSTFFMKQNPSFSSLDSSETKENLIEIQLKIKHHQEQQTSPVNSRRSSKILSPEIIQSDQYKLPFFHLYDTIYKFRYFIINLLEQNQFLALANCLQIIKQLSSNENNLTNDFIENAENIFKDLVKVLQTCITTLQTTINEYQLKEKEFIKRKSESIIEISTIDNHQQSIIIEQKELIIQDLKTKYENLTNNLNQINIRHEEELNQNQRLIQDQQKLIQNLQQDLFRLQKRLIKVETEGITEPSIMFTRLDAQRNEQTLQQAVYKGKLSETTYSELNETMTNYVELPSQQLSNLVKRYIQFRRATEFENRIQTETFDNNTKNVLRKIESLHERRSDQMGKRMNIIRQQRTNLAEILTEKFDELENESSIFLIRPIYSYQGRAATQSYMQHEKRRCENFLKENMDKKKHLNSRQSATTQQKLSPLSSLSISDDEERLFRIEKSIPSTNGQQNDLNHTKQFNGITRLQELDIQRTLMPMSHPNTPLLSAFTANGVDPCVPSLNLRSYVTLSRPGIGNLRIEKPNDIISPIQREGHSVSSARSPSTNSRTPYNSSAGDLRRVGPPLPPIKRLLNINSTPVINNRQPTGFIPSISTNEITAAD